MLQKMEKQKMMELRLHSKQSSPPPTPLRHACQNFEGPSLQDTIIPSD